MVALLERKLLASYVEHVLHNVMRRIMFILLHYKKKEMVMSQIVVNRPQAIENIRKFAAELQGSEGLQNRLAYARSWYAVENRDGSFSFGPSKFVGYQDMTAHEYLDDQPRNGRRTETQLQQWFQEVDEEDEMFDLLSGKLVALLGSYGKVPSTKFRINVMKNSAEGMENRQAVAEKAVVDLIVAVAQTLSPENLSRLRKSI